MASANRNQHWVPQFYLRYFATPETRDTPHPKIWAFPVKEGEEFVANVRNVAAKRDLYNFCDPEVDKRLTDLEGTLAQFWPTITQEGYPIDLGFKKGISLFIATLYLRHPSQLERHRRWTTQFTNVVTKWAAEGNPPQNVPVPLTDEVFEVSADEIEKMRVATDQDIQSGWGDSILNLTGELAQTLIDRPWTILVSRKPAFITSDHPVTPMSSNDFSEGILNANSEMCLPLTPTSLLLINYRGPNQGNIVGIRNDGEEAIFNYYIFRSAYQHVFSSWDPLMVMQQVVAIDEEIREENRRMISAHERTIGKKVGRNDLCPCGSGKKFKRCCIPR
jgi:hypothetical protein